MKEDFVYLNEEQMEMCDGPEFAMGAQVGIVTTHDGKNYKALISGGRRITYIEDRLDIPFRSSDIKAIKIIKEDIRLEKYREKMDPIIAEQLKNLEEDK